MRIAFDQQVFSWQEYGGISRYFCSLAAHLALLPDARVKIFAPLHVNAYLPALPANIRTGIKIKNSHQTDRIVLASSHIMALALMQLYRPDIFHETYYSAKAYAPKGACCVVTAYDMVSERFPEMFRTKGPVTSWKKKSFARADHIICISESTRRDLLEFFDIPASKISVVYLGFDAFSSIDTNMHQLQATPYILYVGQRAAYKNFSNFIQAYASSDWLRRNFRVLCFGGGELSAAEKEMLTRSGLTEAHVQQISGDDTLLGGCYKRAAVFVYPSLYEGFGIPLLEAMSAGCPVVCSDASSIPEVVGAAGEYCDPASIDSIRTSLENVLQSSELRADLTLKGLERCKFFSWEKCASETYALYKALTGSAAR